MKKILLSIFALAAATTMSAQGETKLTVTQLKNLLDSKYYQTSKNWAGGETKGGTVSVHDPSIYYDSKNKMYYVLGSHMGMGKSANLVDWDEVQTGDWVTFDEWWRNYQNGNKLYTSVFWEQFKSNPTRSVNVTVGGVTTTETFPSFDAGAFCSIYDAAGEQEHLKGNQWAADVIWNPTMNKYCQYLSLNGDHWASVIVLLTSDRADGGFTYQGPVVFSGFNGVSYSGKSVNYQNTDLALAIGATDAYNATSVSNGRYRGTGSSSAWGNRWPNCIDPCVFFDDEGDMWLAYGSWSGGIFALKLDKKTGLRDYTYTYPITTYAGTAQGGTAYTGYDSDPYFGKRIAGGAYVSGEGPYIRKIGNYWYLFMSYGGFAPDGGYEMRIFRSESATGPYKDAAGNVATFNSYALNYGANATTNKGMRIIGHMNGWGNMTVGERSQGHNSAIVGADGEAYLVFHTKFNDGTDGHCIRVHRMYTNENGWLVLSPFPYRGVTNPVLSTTKAPYNITTQTEIETTQINVKDLVGEYTYIRHPYKLNQSTGESKPSATKVILKEDGSIQYGSVKGTWSFSQENKNYIKIVLSGVTYYGVVNKQNYAGTAQTAGTSDPDGSGMLTTCISAICESGSNVGVPIWLYKLSSESAVAKNYEAIVRNYINANSTNKDGTTYKPTLTEDAPAPLYGAIVSYESSNKEVFSDAGKITPIAEKCTLTIKPIMTVGTCYYQVTSNRTVYIPADPTAADQVMADADENRALPRGKRINLAGQEVDMNYKGIVIINGNKYVVK